MQDVAREKTKGTSKGKSNARGKNAKPADRFPDPELADFVEGLIAFGALADALKKQNPASGAGAVSVAFGGLFQSLLLACDGFLTRSRNVDPIVDLFNALARICLARVPAGGEGALSNEDRLDLGLPMMRDLGVFFGRADGGAPVSQVSRVIAVLLRRLAEATERVARAGASTDSLVLMYLDALEAINAAEARALGIPRAPGAPPVRSKGAVQ